MAVSLGPEGLILDNTTMPHDTPGLIVKTEVIQSPSSADNFSVSANTNVIWWSHTFTTLQANSRILINYHSGQINAYTSAANFNALLEWSVDSTNRGSGMAIYREHNHEWYQFGGSEVDKRFFITGTALSNTLSAGSHTIRAWAGTYNADLIFAHQGNSGGGLRRPAFVIQELTT